MDFNSLELIGYYVNLEILYQGYYFENLLVKPGTLVRHALRVCGSCHVSNLCFGRDIRRQSFIKFRVNQLVQP